MRLGLACASAGVAQHVERHAGADGEGGLCRTPATTRSGPRPASRLTPAQYRSPLGRRPYDLRHAAVSLWLNSGVPATEVARRAGHGVAVLLKIYAHWIDG